MWLFFTFNKFINFVIHQVTQLNTIQFFMMWVYLSGNKLNIKISVAKVFIT